MSGGYRIERLSRRHDRGQFGCGEPALDRYLARQARQDDDRRVCRVWVLVSEPSGPVPGFYTLSAHTARLAELPDDLARRLPRYPLVPAILLGRLAVDASLRGQGLGSALLADALVRCLALSAEVGAALVVVQAKDNAARTFYEKHGFRSFSDDPLALFASLAVIGQAAG